MYVCRPGAVKVKAKEFQNKKNIQNNKSKYK